MALSTRTVTQRTEKGEPIRTGLAVVLRPGVMVNSTAEYVSDDYHGTVIDCGPHAARVRFKSGREHEVLYRDLEAVVTGPAPACDEPAPPSAAEDAEPLDFPELSGEYDIFDRPVDRCDRRYGVPVPIGTLAYSDSFGWGRVLGGE